MAWTKTKIAITVAVGVLLAAGTTTVTVTAIAAHRDNDSWRAKRWFDSSVLDRAKPQVRILPSKYQFGGDGGSNGRMMGLGTSLEHIVENAWNYGSHRTIYSTKLPRNRYDYIASLPLGNQEALQRQIEKQFGLVAHVETVETNVLLLEVASQNAAGLVRGDTGEGGGMSASDTMFKCDDEPISVLAGNLESYYGVPVIDQTHLEDNYDINIKWRNLNDLKRVLLNQLGLELVPGVAPVKMLVVEKAQ